MLGRKWSGSLLLVNLCTVVSAQQLPGPETAEGMHYVGAPQTTSVRSMALGSAFAAIPNERTPANPAGLADRHEGDALWVKLADAHFAQSPDLQLEQFNYVKSLGDYGNVLLFAMEVSGTDTLNGSRQDAHGRYLGIQYGYRLSDEWKAGISWARLPTDFTVDAPAPVGRVVRIESENRGLGARIGLQHVGPEGTLWGLSYDDYKENVTRTSQFLAATEHSVFHSRILRVGLSRQTSPKTLFTLDAERVRVTSSLGFVHTDKVVCGGLEYRPTDSLALRVGDYDGRLTGGLGFKKGDWTVDYAFTNRYKVNLPTQAATAHYLELGREF